MEEIIQKLKKFSKDFRKEIYDDDFSVPSNEEVSFYGNYQNHLSFSSAMFMPHESQYIGILKYLKNKDIVIDMGSGDFRFPLLVSKKVKKVYALELNPSLVQNVLNIIGYKLPRNLIIICADWFNFPIPFDVTVITCLCNGAIYPKEWLKYKIIIGDQEGIKVVEKTTTKNKIYWNKSLPNLADKKRGQLKQGRDFYTNEEFEKQRIKILKKNYHKNEQN